MWDRSKRRGSPLDVPHPDSPAGRNFDYASLGVPHPNSPAGRNFDYSSSLGVRHPNSPAGRTGLERALNMMSELRRDPYHLGSGGIEVTKTSEDIECFKRKPGMDKDEFERAVKIAEREINKTDVETLSKRIEKLEGKGAKAFRDKSFEVRLRKALIEQNRTASDHLALLYQEMYPLLSADEARASVEREATRLHLSHRLDTGALGPGLDNPRDRHNYGGLGDKDINEHMWQQWREGRLDALKREIEKAKRAGNKKMNIKLKICPE